MEKLFYQIGMSTIFIYLLGHEDFHPGNFLISKGKGIILDFETTGQGVVFDKYSGNGMTHFQLVSELFVFMPKKFNSVHVSKFYHGMLNAVVKGRQFYSTFLREWNRSIESQLFSRLVIRWTMDYREKEMNVIPHYTVSVDLEGFSSLIQRRSEALLKELQSTILVSDPESERGITFKTAFWKLNLAFEASL